MKNLNLNSAFQIIAEEFMVLLGQKKGLETFQYVYRQYIKNGDMDRMIDRSGTTKSSTFLDFAMIWSNHTSYDLGKTYEGWDHLYEALKKEFGPIKVKSPVLSIKKVLSNTPEELMKTFQNDN